MEPRDFVAVLLFAVFLAFFAVAELRRRRRASHDRDPIDWDSRQL